MVFSSLTFLFGFLPIFLILYYLIQEKYRNALLFIGSLVFYGFGEPSFLFLILCTILANFYFGKWISHFHDKPLKKKLILILSLIYNLGILLFFKYTNFFIENVNHLLRLQNSNTRLDLLDLALPLGISFYTFQIVSYIIDVYRGTIKAETSIINLGAYLCMFPQLIAGPIVIYSDISQALKNRSVSIYNLDRGLKIFIWGLAYKVILANRIGTLWNDVCTIGYESISTPLAWLGALAYAMQLYFDFCGYSLMAIGLGDMLGFRMPENFRHPYMARSVTDFWRRWHITLGAWFKEYVYIPLGGNRKGKTKTIRNLFVVWFLVGFWHGADWNFILWGLLIFVCQIIEKNLTLPWLTKDNIISKIFSHCYMIVYILVSWTIFAISDFEQLGIYLARMFPFFGIGQTINSLDFLKYLGTYGPLLALCLLFCTDYPKKAAYKLKDHALSNTVGVGIALGVFWYAVYFLSIGMNNPFLYFRF